MFAELDWLGMTTKKKESAMATISVCDSLQESGFGKLLYGFEDFGGVALGGRFVPDFGDAAVRTDQKCGAHNSEEGFAEKLLHAPSAVSLDGLEFGIAQHGEIQIVFGSEFRLSFHTIAAAAQDNCA
jgi:hypothetical protein